MPLPEPVFSDRYAIIWEPRDPLVGEVRNFTIDDQRYRTIRIALDDETLSAAHMRFLSLTYYNANPAILVSTAFMNLPLNTREAAIWHEVGHVHYEHMLQEGMLEATPEEIRDARIAAINRGTVLTMELEADTFAVARAGPAFVAFLEFLLSTRPTKGIEWNNLGRKELERRIMLARRNEA